MKKQVITYPETMLIGLSVRTNSKNEQNPETSKIGALVSQYWGQGVAQHISHRKNPGTTVIAYTNYATDEYGDYDCFIGEMVTSLSQVPATLTSIVIPEGKYCKFTTEKGEMPAVVINAWQTIWKMDKEKDFGGQRTYLVDFEIYDERAHDPKNTILDIYLGIK